MELGLDNKVVVVTGSTGGIGKAIAIAFAKANAVVVVNGRTEAGVNKAVEEIKALVPTAQLKAVAADVSTEEGTDAFIKQMGDLEVEVLVNNVGIFETKDFFDTTDDYWRKFNEVNVMSVVRLCRHYLKPMLARNSGRVLIMASEAGFKPLPHMIHYSVTKSALIGLSRGLAELTKGTNVTVNSIAAGPTMTDGVRTYMDGLAASKGEDVNEVEKSYFKDSEPTSLIQRFISVEEVAHTTLFLASKHAGAINGSSQRVEGGIIRHI